MSTALDSRLREELQHFRDAPDAFDAAWKRGVELVGYFYFGEGTREDFVAAQDKWALRPNVPLIRRAIGSMSSGEKVFLAVLVSFYNAKEGGALLRRVGVQGFSDLGGLDLARRRVIAELVLTYCGW